MKTTVPPEPTPPTVAPARPAREVAHEFGSFLCGPNGEHCIACDRFVTAIERDRASRSPGPTPAAEPACGRPSWCWGEKWCDGNPCTCRDAVPLSGLDAATVEAADAVVAHALSTALDTDAATTWLRIVRARLRALATPPGKAKP